MNDDIRTRVKVKVSTAASELLGSGVISVSAVEFLHLV